MKNKNRGKKILTAVVILLLTFVVGIVVFVAIFPTLVSLDWTKNFLTTRLSRELNRPVQIDSVRFGWSGGLNVSGFRIEDAPRFSSRPIVSIPQIKLVFHPSSLLQKKLRFDLSVNDSRFQVIRAKEGETNLEALIAGLPTPKASGKKKKPKPSPGKRSFYPPLDIQSRIRITGTDIHIHDRSRHQRLEIRDAAFKLDMPSLLEKPVEMETDSGLMLDEKKMPRVHFDARFVDLFADNRLNLKKARIHVNGRFPGITANISGNPTAEGLKGETRIDISQTMKLLKPLLPETLSETFATGKLDIRFTFAGKPGEKIDFDVTFGGESINWGKSGEENPESPPIAFGFTTEGWIDPENKILKVRTKKSRFLKNTRFRFSARLADWDKPEKNLELTLSDFYFDIKETIAALGSRIPDMIAVETGNDKNHFISVEKIGINAVWPEGPGGFSLESAKLELPKITVKTKSLDVNCREGVSVIDSMMADWKGRPSQIGGTFSMKGNIRASRLNWKKKPGISVEDFFVSGYTVDADIANGFLEKIAFKANTKTAKIAVSSPNLLTAQGVAISGLSLVMDGMKRNKNAFLGVTAKITLKEKATIEKIDIQKLASINKLSQSADAEWELEPGVPVSGRLNGFTLDVSNVSLKDPQFKGAGLPVRMTANIAGMALSGVKPFSLDITGLKNRMFLGDMVTVHASADIKDSGKKAILASAKIDSDLNRMNGYFQRIPAIKNRLDDNVKSLSLFGKASGKLRLNGRLPREKQLEGLRKFSTIDMSRDLDFIKQLDISFGLQDSGIRDGRFAGFDLEVANMSSTVDYRLEPAEKKGNLSGDFFLEGIKPSASMVKTQTPLRLSGDFSAVHEQFDSVDGSADLKIDPFRLSGSLKFHIGGLSRLVQEKPDGEWMKKALKYVTAKVSSRLELKKGATADIFGKKARIHGNAKANATVNYDPRKALKTNLETNIDALDVSFGDMVELERFSGKLALEKSYRTSQSLREGEGSGISLSERVMGMNGIPVRDNLNPENRFAPLNDIRKRMGGSRDFSFEKLRLSASSPLRLVLHRGLFDFDMEQGLPRLDFFQFDVLDGAVIGSIDIRPVEEYFFSTFVVQFSGLNIEKLPALPGSAKMTKTPEQSAVSGRMVISLPLQSRVQALLRSGEVQIDLYDIGSRTLDRLLYALDPYESNETIVQQRKLVRNGYPLWVKIRIKNGMFFLEGKVSVKGIEMDIPTLERFNLTGLPGMEKYEKYLESVELVTKALNILHANAIVANDKGEIIFNRENIHDTN